MKKKLISLLLVIGGITSSFISCGQDSNVKKVMEMTGMDKETLESLAEDSGMTPEEFAEGYIQHDKQVEEELGGDTASIANKVFEEESEQKSLSNNKVEKTPQNNDSSNFNESMYSELEESDIMMTLTKEEAESIGITNDKYISYWENPKEFLDEYENISALKNSGSCDPKLASSILPNSGFFKKLIDEGVTKEECIENEEVYKLNIDFYATNLFLKNIKGKTYNEAATCFDEVRKTSSFLESISNIYAENQFEFMEPESQVQFLMDMANNSEYLK